MSTIIVIVIGFYSAVLLCSIFNHYFVKGDSIIGFQGFLRTFEATRCFRIKRLNDL